MNKPAIEKVRIIELPKILDRRGNLSFFENEKIFPKGSVKFDNALLMKSIEHEWKSLKEIKNTKPNKTYKQ